MIHAASREVLDSIYEISIGIIQRIVDENNRMPLARIYQAALRGISKCPNAIKFIHMLAQRELTVVTMDVIAFNEYDREFADVTRSVKKLVPPEVPFAMVTITDCHSYTNVACFLPHDLRPALLPFATQREMLEGMSRVVHDVQPRRARAGLIRARNSSGGDAPELETPVESVPIGGFDEMAPLIHPTKLITDPNLLLDSEQSSPCFSFDAFFEEATP
jgi:hypothetical protein